MTDIDETLDLKPRWNRDGLIAAIAQDAKTNEILMMAWMNAEALHKTLTTKEAHYWSRSRHKLWHKGATSGAIQIVEDIRIDCDQDTVLLRVKPQAPGACHTGRRSCFYRSVENLRTLKMRSADA